ncbi:MAG TPA: hypothetical protein VF545_01200 [Thermoleophilaceae bacterium]
MRSERGQATVEWIGLVLLVALALGGFAALAPVFGGRTLAELVLRRIVCTVRGDCRGAREREYAELVAAYGPAGAALVRRHAPSIAYEPGTYTLPVDWRQCRSHRCSDAPDRAGLDVNRSKRGGYPATAFTHLVRRGGETFIQYWLYYPDSTTTWGGAAGAWNKLSPARRGDYPGFHRDDWEAYEVRLDAGGRALVRASSHHGHQYCKGASSECRDRWGPETGWTRVSRGSHAGHIPSYGGGGHVRGSRGSAPVDRPHERTTRAGGLRLVPLERIDPRSYRSQDPDGPTPPWAKDVYSDPTSNSTG